MALAPQVFSSSFIVMRYVPIAVPGSSPQARASGQASTARKAGASPLALRGRAREGNRGAFTRIAPG
jgi:hypothetical protein